MAADSEKPKIIVDEDWKTQVQSEKEAAKGGHTVPGSSPSTPAPSVPEQTVESAPQHATSDDDLPEMELPPASLVFLCTTLATQAMIALGQIPNPITGKTDLRLKQAKHYIDTLGMLEEKTSGNRTADESGLFDGLLHQLRMAYVALQNAPTSRATKES
jgi:hypothetical protein